MQIELFDARMLAPLVGFLERHGTRAEPLLDRARIPGELIQAGGWITKKQAYDFTFDVVQRTGCREAVFSAYLDFDLKHLGPVAAAMKACATVKESLEVGLRLGSTAYEGNEYFLRMDGDTTWLCYREPRVVSAGHTFINDMTMAVYCQLIRALADDGWRPERMMIRDEVNERHRAVENFADCSVSRHPQLTALAVPTKLLSRRLPAPLRTSDPSASQPWQFGPDGSEPILERTYRLIASRFPYRKLPTLEQLASIVDVSPATLKRWLAAAGTSYRGLLDRVCFDAACKMLTIPEVTVKEIAAELGYSDTSNFVRGFRRMTGMPPEKYRRKHLLSGVISSK